ncbi:glycoside hydrolase family 99-like domain-containing protein [Humisphaera borealis]|uniref:Glycoside hydrolase family 99-like domain-containing protein n=1 Tax=Humisphaera borealis TaxID=2807512 RepID=A0A7M2WPI7_9BACT|nr:glycoside hydrolase family 99-like domain-containing protein [Humisphaera borealis]QOV87376.1 glycoside hydrolase family 99-like domain-containing protein [Humisphaera borealis]
MVSCIALVLALATTGVTAWTAEPAQPVPPTQRAASTGERLVGAYYYPWYYKERWTNEPVCNTPALGWYTSDDRKVAAEHIRFAKQADIDFFLVSWLKADGREGKNLKDAVLPELASANFRFALLYETPLALDTPAGKPIDLAAKLTDGKAASGKPAEGNPAHSPTAGDRMVEHFDHLADTYLKHPQYLRFGGKAVVTVYLVRDMINAGAYLKSIRQRMSDRGIDLYLIADVIYWESPDKLDWAFLKEHFQAVTAYNMYYRPKFLDAVQKQFKSADSAARAQGMRLIPNVMPGYDDTPLRGTERVTINRRRGQFYRENWGVASAFVGPDQPFLLITTFNEWHEGTEVEPSTEYGDMYLKLTRELTAGIRGR